MKSGKIDASVFELQGTGCLPKKSQTKDGTVSFSCIHALPMVWKWHLSIHCVKRRISVLLNHIDIIMFATAIR